MALPKVVIDARMVRGVPHGIGRYVETLALGLRQLRDREGGLSFEPVFFIDRRSTTVWNETAIGAFRIHACSSRFLNPLEWWEIPRALKRSGASLFHSTSFASFPRLPVPWIQTIHDLNHLSYGGMAHKQYYRRLLKPFASKAQAVFSVSNAAAAEVSAWLKRPVACAPNAFEPPGRASGDAYRELGLASRRYFLLVANDKAHKNADFLVDCYMRARKRSEDPARFPPLAATVKITDRARANGVMGLSGVSTPVLQSLVANAIALVSPSLYEGFGRPPVEALIAGTPAWASDIPPHREVLQDFVGIGASLLPLERDAWVRAFLKATQERFVRVEASVGEELLRRYSPLGLAQIMAQAYGDALAHVRA